MLILEAGDHERQEHLGAALALVCPGACIVYLEGDLGTGKTTLVRGFLRGMGYQGKVRSPTYTLLEPYEFNGRTVYHLDLYRLAHPEELEYLALRDLFGDNCALFVEWPDRGRHYLPTPDLVLEFEEKDEARFIRCRTFSVQGQQLAQLVSSDF